MLPSTTTPWDDVDVRLGYDTELQVAVSADDQDRITYQWYDQQWNVIEGETSDTLLIQNVSEATTYICHIDDGYENQCEVYFYIYIEHNYEVTEAVSPTCINDGSSRLKTKASN